MNKIVNLAASTALVGAGLLAGTGAARAGESSSGHDHDADHSSSSSYEHDGDDRGDSDHDVEYVTAEKDPGLLEGLLGGLGGTVDGLLGT